MKIFRWIIIFLSFTSCNNDNKPGSTSRLTGSWKLVESYMSIGGPGSWSPADPNNPSYIEFTGNGQIRMTPVDENSPTGYKLINDSTLIMSGRDQQFNYRFRLTGKELILYPPCIEGCASRYTAVEK